jgi:hypothetical protein
MKPRLLPSGLQRGIPFLIQEDWSPDQALAVIELLDDLREVIWQRYQLPLQDLLREQRGVQDESNSVNISDTDPPF